MSVRDFLDANVTHAAVRRELDLLVRTVTASEPSDLSFLYFLYFLGICGGLAGVGDGDGGAQSYKLAGGAQQLCCRLSATLEELGADIRLGSPVRAVAWTAHGGVAITTTHHERVAADRLVLAVSPPLWSTIDWTPQLPPAKRAIAQRMYMGSAVKTIAVYKQPFWASASASAASSHKHLEELGPVANLFPSKVGGAPALIGLVTAGAAVAFAALPEAERRGRVLQQYTSYFGSADATTQCTAFLSKDWTSEPYSRGCYAALMPPGLATAGGGAAAASPLGGSVFFAGTELGGRWAGYFEGAIESGYRAAAEVVASLSAARARL